MNTPKYKLKKNHVLVLRTCNKDMSSRGKFKWPKEGPVCAPDFRKDYNCGNGLHGFLWGEGDGDHASWSADAKWLVVEVEASDIMHGQGQMIGKCKFPKGNVIYAGTREVATEIIKAHRPQASVVGGTATAGYAGTATAGDSGIIMIRWWDTSACRYRIAVAYVGENGIKPNTLYRVVDGKIEEAK